MNREERRITDERAVTGTDQELRELVSQHAARYLSSPVNPYPIEEKVVEPEGMTVQDEAELESLLEMADPTGSGDEQAAIERLVDLLDTARDEAEGR